MIVAYTEKSTLRGGYIVRYPHKMVKLVTIVGEVLNDYFYLLIPLNGQHDESEYQSFQLAWELAWWWVQVQGRMG